jgi:hypothetical protein
MKKTTKGVNVLVCMLALTALQSQAALITNTDSFYHSAYATTGLVYGPETIEVYSASDIILNGFDSTLGSLTEVSFSYNLTASFSGDLWVNDPRTGVLRENNVHGGGFSAFLYYLIAESDFPINFTDIIESGTYQLECDNDFSWDDPLDNSNDCTADTPAYSASFSNTFTYTALTDLDYFLNAPLEFSSLSVAGSKVEFCDDTEDFCRLNSRLQFRGNLQVSYEYTEFDDSPDPINEVSAPTSLTLMSLGLLGLMIRKRKQRE